MQEQNRVNMIETMNRYIIDYQIFIIITLQELTNEKKENAINQSDEMNRTAKYIVEILKIFDRNQNADIN